LSLQCAVEAEMVDHCPLEFVADDFSADLTPHYVGDGPTGPVV
jgi:hypothetical protein